MKGTLLPLLLLAWTVSTPAQQSANFKVSDHALNAGGESLLASSNFRLTLNAVGEGVTAFGLGSPGYTMDGGFTVCYPPPGEVAPCNQPSCGPLLEFTSKQELTWPPERSAGAYNLYRALLVDLDPPEYGACLQEQIPGTTTVDTDAPASGSAYFYLVTAENRLAEEGSKGFDSAGSPRRNLPPSTCP